MQTPSETNVDVSVIFLNLGGFAAKIFVLKKKQTAKKI
jgi:hypothetical protein